MYRNTKTVAGILGGTVSRLAKAVWLGRVPSPQRGPDGSFLWAEDDIQKAAWALLRRDMVDSTATHRSTEAHDDA